MNGFYLLNKYDIQSYLNVLANTEPYQNEEGLCIDIEYKDADFTLVFLKPMELPGEGELASLIKALIELDLFIASRDRAKEQYLKDKCEYQFSYVEMSNPQELVMYYCGVNVNTQWGAEFKKNESSKWEFQGLC